jgi:YfiH family protein
MSDFRLVDLAGGWTVGRFASLDAIAGVRHLVTTRRALDVNVIRADRDFTAKALAETTELRGVAYLEQVHGDTIVQVSSSGLSGKGDGLITDSPGLGLMCVSADCPLILVADAEARAVGAAHASWRGTVKQIAYKLIRRMAERYGLDASRMTACVCPSAGPERYEVGQDVLDAALAGIGEHVRQFFRPRGDKFLLDLWAANRDQLLRAGVREENIHVAGICTMTRNDLFPSHRLEGGRAGRFAAVIAKG